MSELHILLVEDDPDGQEVVGRILRHHHIVTDIATTGEEALNLLAKGSYNAAIVDLNLPSIDGWKLLQTIQANPKVAHMPCIAVTAFHSAEVAVKAIEAGFTAYFSKPIEPGSFVQELQQYIL